VYPSPSSFIIIHSLMRRHFDAATLFSICSCYDTMMMLIRHDANDDTLLDADMPMPRSPRRSPRRHERR